MGGETASLRGLVNGLDLAGAVLGVQRRDRVISGEACRPGDLVVGLPSSGVHSNGLSLARRIVESHGGYGQPFGSSTLGRELLTPTRIYSEVLGLVERHEVHGMCHITGGGLLNLARLTDYGFAIDDPIAPPPVFAWLQEQGGVSTTEMYRTFNMGMGFAMVVPEHEAEPVAREVPGAKVVGRCTAEPGDPPRRPSHRVKERNEPYSSSAPSSAQTNGSCIARSETIAEFPVGSSRISVIGNSPALASAISALRHSALVRSSGSAQASTPSTTERIRSRTPSTFVTKPSQAGPGVDLDAELGDADRPAHGPDHPDREVVGRLHAEGEPHRRALVEHLRVRVPVAADRTGGRDDQDIRKVWDRLGLIDVLALLAAGGTRSVHDDPLLARGRLFH